jgi:hypothetical protein
VGTTWIESCDPAPASIDISCLWHVAPWAVPYMGVSFPAVVLGTGHGKEKHWKIKEERAAVDVQTEAAPAGDMHMGKGGGRGQRRG